MAWPKDTVLDPLLGGWDFEAFDAGTLFTQGWYDLFQDPMPPSVSEIPWTQWDPRFSPLVYLLRIRLRRR